MTRWFFVLIGDLHHGKPHDLLTQLEAFLEHLGDGVLGCVFILGVHHGVVDIGIKFIAHIAEDFHTQSGEDLHKLVHGHLHALLVGGILGGLVQSPLQIVVDGKHLFHSVDPSDK